MLLAREYVSSGEVGNVNVDVALSADSTERVSVQDVVFSGGIPSFISGLDCDLNNSLSTFTKDLVSLCNPIERERVGQKWSQIQTSMADKFHKPAHAFFPTRAQGGDDLVVAKPSGEGLQWNRKLS